MPNPNFQTWGCSIMQGSRSGKGRASRPLLQVPHVGALFKSAYDLPSCFRAIIERQVGLRCWYAFAYRGGIAFVEANGGGPFGDITKEEQLFEGNIGIQRAPLI